MAKIRLLDKSIAELIAAGEVVERPSSVIKELIENSVDAKASVITIEIRGGGISFMRITDNGTGIPREDVPTAFLRHATSKIGGKDDLDAIATLGFRGEALASISAVSRVEMLTKTAEDNIGTRYVIDGSAPRLEEAGCPTGTTIIIRDLFYNTPARMKFLKKDVTEGNAIAGIVDKLALSHPEISIRFIRDGKEQLHTAGDSKLISAIYSVFGKDFGSSLIPVDYSLGGIGVKGYISLPTASRANRSMQNFFINGRFIRSRTAMAAIEEAYKGSIMVGKFPACVLDLTMSYEAVDVNVHPAKLEVRFVNERPIFEAVYHGVKSALAKGDKTKEMQFKKPPAMPDAPAYKHKNLMFEGMGGAGSQKAGQKQPANNFFEDKKTERLNDPARADVKKTTASFIDSVIDREVTPEYNELLCKQQKPEENLSDGDLLSRINNIPAAVPETSAGKSIGTVAETEAEVPLAQPKTLPGVIPEGILSEQPNVPVQQAMEAGETENEKVPEIFTKLIGEAFDTYIILQYGKDALMLIDKHAAHERILYEKIKAENGMGTAQTLLEPVIVTLDKDEYSAVLNNLDVLEKSGFMTEDFGRGSVVVRSAPLLLSGSDVSSAVMEIAGYLSSFKTDITTEHLDWVYHNVACRAAIKGGNKSSDSELIALAKQLEENPSIRYCPHGRPVSIIIKRKDLEKQFGRI